ncbi:thiamine ABC transporter substrate-binding protein [Candidatus Poseidoniales archaeon]|nr:thiamine ABC transporter substrate-binding protein [Candidatus Poseidoniales archaeon]
MLSLPLSGCLDTPSDDLECNDGKDTGDDCVLTIVTYDILAITDDVVNEFTNQTGFEVKMIRTDDAGGILEHLLLTKDNPQADLALGLDNTYLQTAFQFDLLAEHGAQIPVLESKATIPYNGNKAVPFDQGYICLNADTQALSDNNLSFPTTLEELTAPEWKGKTAFPSPVTSSPGRAFMVASIDYFEQQSSNTTAFDWWADMAENDAIFTSGWTEAYETHYTGGYGKYEPGYIGDAWLTVSYCHSPGVEAFYGGNSTISAAVDIDFASFSQVEYAASVNGGGSKNAVNAFIEFLLTDEVNTNMPENNLMYSVLEGEDLPETDGYRYHSPVPTQPSTIEMDRIGQEMDDWLKEWRDSTNSI